MLKALICCLLVASSAGFYLSAKPFSYIKQTDFAVAYKSVLTADRFVIALPRQANYIDVFFADSTQQNASVSRLELDELIYDAAWINGYLVVASGNTTGFYQLDDNGHLTLSWQWQNKVVHSIDTAADFMAVQTLSSVELYKWQQGQPDLIDLYVKPQGFFRADIALTGSALLVAWRHSYPMTEVRTVLVKLATMEKNDFAINDVAGFKLVSAEQFVQQNRNGETAWMQWLDDNWHQLNNPAYISDLSFLEEDQLILKGNALYQFYNSRPSTINLFKLEQDTIAAASFTVSTEQNCLNVQQTAQEYYCLYQSGIRTLNWDSLLPKTKQQLVNFTEAFSGFARSASQLYLYGKRELRALTFDTSQAVDVAPALQQNYVIRDVLAIDDKLIVESTDNFYTQYWHQPPLYQQEFQTYLGRGWEGNVEYQQANQHFMLLNGRRNTPWFELYPLGFPSIMATEPVKIQWAQIELPDGASIDLVRRFELADNWLILSASVEVSGGTFADRLYAVPLDLQAMQLAGPAVALQSEHLTEQPIAYHQLAYHQGYLYVRQSMLQTKPVSVFQLTSSDWLHVNTITTSLSCGSGTLNITEQLLVTAPGFLSFSNKVCLFDLSANKAEPVFLGELNLPGDVPGSNVNSVQVESVGANLLAGQQNDGRVSVFKKNMAPTVQQQVTSVAEDSSAIVIAAAEDAEFDQITLSLLQQPANGSATLDGDSIRYQPVADFNGIDQLVLRSTDSHGNYTDNTLSMVVTPVNDAPTMQDVSFTVQQGTTLIVPLTAQDIDGDTLVFSLLNSAGKGSATINSSGVLSYSATTPGQDILQVQVTDPSGLSAIANLNVTVSAEPAVIDNNNAQSSGGAINIWILFALLLCCYRNAVASRKN